jgi:hypothetical protein
MRPERMRGKVPHLRDEEHKKQSRCGYETSTASHALSGGPVSKDYIK